MDVQSRQPKSNSPAGRTTSSAVQALAETVDVPGATLLSAVSSTDSAMVMRSDELQAMYDAMTDFVCMYDQYGSILHANRALRDLLGVDAQSGDASHLAEKYTPLMFPGDELGRLLPKHQWPVSRVLKGEVLKAETAIDIIIYLADGRELVLNVNGAPLRNHHHQIIGAILVMRDITGRRSLELDTREMLTSVLAMAETLIETSDSMRDIPSDPSAAVSGATGKAGKRLVELVRDILGCLSVGFTSIDAASGVISPIAVVGLPPARESEWWRDLQHLTLADYLNVSTSSRIMHGEELALDLMAQPFPNRSNYGVQSIFLFPLRVGGRFVGAMGIEFSHKNHHFTPDEVAFIKAIAKFAALLIERTRLQWQWTHSQANELMLQEINQRMSEFLSITSHELRTPLAIVKGNIQLTERQLRRFDRMLLQENTQPAQLITQLEHFRQSLSEATNQIHQLERLVNDLLDISRNQSSSLEMQVVLCDLASIVRAVVKELRLLNPDRSLALKLRPKVEVPILADVARITQVATNYLTNALKYSLPEQPISVTVSIAKHMATVTVRDEGVGLTPAEQERIWERFYRVERIQGQSGLGLGLYICKMIIQAHHGHVGVQSALGAGSTFWFSLPLTKETG